LVGQLVEAIEHVEQLSEGFKPDAQRSAFSPALRKHIKELQQARRAHGPMRLSPAWPIIDASVLLSRCLDNREKLL
jgi:hypothetical protein